MAKKYSYQSNRKIVYWLDFEDGFTVFVAFEDFDGYRPKIMRYDFTTARGLINACESITERNSVVRFDGLLMNETRECKSRRIAFNRAYNRWMQRTANKYQIKNCKKTARGVRRCG